ncbi:ATP-binding protein [Patescibacteria group bacterium]|nr:ATP-binding protein [Patescibacteria group bacterium]
MPKITLKKLHLILIAGHVGSGKTHLAKKLAKKINCLRIDKDIIDDSFTTSRLSNLYQSAARPYIHKIMYNLAESNLSDNTSVIIDAPYTKAEKYLNNPTWLKLIKNIAKKHKATIKLIWCTADNKTRQHRILKRNHERDQERKDQFKRYVGAGHLIPIPFKHLLFDSTKDSLNKVIKFLAD